MFKLKLFKIFFSVLAIASVANCYDLEEYVNLIKFLSLDKANIEDFEKNIEYLLQIEPNYFSYTPFTSGNTFNCLNSTNSTELDQEDELDAKKNRTVHKLRPKDIQVVAAMGDSITASFGTTARNIIELLIENRGRSWSIGGDLQLEQSATLPNFLRKFNPNLVGFSTGSNLVFIYNKGRGLNEAVSGNEANHMSAQAERLIQKLKSSENINFDNDWKLITLFIGGNDLCRFCKNYEKHSPKAYIDDIERALDLLYKNVPRALVNLVSILDVSQLKDYNRAAGLVCKALHVLECRCAAYPSESEENYLKDYEKQYQNFTQQLALSGKYDQRDDFSVVNQPFFTDFRAPYLPDGKPDLSYLAPDCFHFSTKGHAAAAIGLWNNMLQPVGKKSTTWTPNDPILCPGNKGKARFIYTNKNSN